MLFKDIKKHKIPIVPGVYFFLGKKSRTQKTKTLKGRRVLYIGKAGSLKNRVRSYFSKDIFLTRGPGILKMIDEAEDIVFEKTDSVLEAVIFESKYIKEYTPFYNVRDKDDKSFNHVVITDEDFPRVLIIRGRDLKQKIKSYKIKASYGPFPQSGILKEALCIIRKIFPFHDKCTKSCFKKGYRCKKKKTVNKSLRSLNGKSCFYRQIGLCPGVCTGEISKDEYGKTIKNIRLLFEGKKKTVLERLETEMKRTAQKKEFEKATRLRNQIFALKHLRDVSLLKEMPRKNIIHHTNGHTSDSLPWRVEGYDIAHLRGDEAVGVMVVFLDGEPQKREYRKFIVKESSTGGDVPALREVLERRLNHKEWEYPSLVVVDGGKAQINTAKRLLHSNGRAKGGRSSLLTKVVGVVKDERHRPKRIEGDKELARKHEKEILFVNSEAHRFAIAFHRKRLRLKNKKV